jgi:hypothetical protein
MKTCLMTIENKNGLLFLRGETTDEVRVLDHPVKETVKPYTRFTSSSVFMHVSPTSAAIYLRKPYAKLESDTYLVMYDVY